MNMANLNPKRTQRCNQSSLVGTLKGTTPRHRPSSYAAFGKQLKWTPSRHRPSSYVAFARKSQRATPDTVLRGMRPSARNLNGRPPDTVLQVPPMYLPRMFPLYSLVYALCALYVSIRTGHAICDFSRISGALRRGGRLMDGPLWLPQSAV